MGKRLLGIYFLFYSQGNSRIGSDGDQEFFNAAWTRKMDIETSQHFDSNKDLVLVLPFTDISKLKETVEEYVDKYSKIYGKTKEVGFWSHAGYDGPIGTVYSDYDDIIDNKQLSIDGWSKINFNWEHNASIGFYGCNTGNPSADGTKSFAQKISEKMPNINVYGQPSSSYFSSSTRQAKKVGNNIITYKNKDFLRTYLISPSKRPFLWWFDSSVSRMKYFKNGKMIR